MRTTRIITGITLALSICGHGVGQQMREWNDDAAPKWELWRFQETQPAPTLKCDKYQHVDSPPQFCGDQLTIDKDGKLHDSCYPPHCVDDTHRVTERDWQELMERMKKLESMGKR